MNDDDIDPIDAQIRESVREVRESKGEQVDREVTSTRDPDFDPDSLDDSKDLQPLQLSDREQWERHHGIDRDIAEAQADFKHARAEYDEPSWKMEERYGPAYAARARELGHTAWDLNLLETAAASWSAANPLLAQHIIALRQNPSLATQYQPEHLSFLARAALELDATINEAHHAESFCRQHRITPGEREQIGKLIVEGKVDSLNEGLLAVRATVRVAKVKHGGKAVRATNEKKVRPLSQPHAVGDDADLNRQIAEAAEEYYR